MKTLLTDPDAFFREEVTRDRLAHPAAIVVAAAIVQVLAQYRLMEHAFSGIAEFEPGLLVLGIPSVIAFAVVVGIWLAVAAVVHVISIVFDGEGPFLDTLRLTGWGWVPAVIAALLTLAVTYVVLPELQAPSDPQNLQVAFQQYQSHQLVELATGVSVGLTIWQGLFWTFAVKHARTLSTREAAMTVAIPVALLVAWYGVNLL